MIETPKTLKELMWDIHHSRYDLADALIYALKATEKPKAHQVTDTTTQQEVKS